jgi:hypothetical protein
VKLGFEHDSKEPTAYTSDEHRKGYFQTIKKKTERRAIQCPATKNSVILSVLDTTNRLCLPLLYVVWSGDLKLHEFFLDGL